MGLKKWIARRFISKFMNKSFLMQFPGLLYSKFNVENQSRLLRHVFLYEDFLASLEVEVKKKFGEKGQKSIYKAGKCFGLYFSQMTNMHRLDTRFRDLKTTVFVQYLETMYATKISHKVNWDSKKIEFELFDYVICRKNGQGDLLTTGGAAGMWSHICDDPTIESEHPKCEGRGDDHCELICSPNVNSKSVVDIPSFEFFKKYQQLNSITPLETSSLHSYLEHKHCTYKGGHMLLGEKRFIPFDSSLIYFYEKEISTLGEYAIQLIHDVAFEEYRNFAQYILTLYNKEKYTRLNALDFANHFLGAFGFGQLCFFANKSKMYAKKYPYFEYGIKTFPTYTGMLSGLISGLTKENIAFDVKKDVITNDSYDLVLEPTN